LENKPLVSIIITNYNYGKYIVSAIESARNQTYNNIEIIVIDDGSSDGSWEILKSYYKAKSEIINAEYRSVHVHKNLLLFNINNSGASNARNFGISKCSADSKYISILDGDDTYTPTRIEKLVAKLEEYDELGVAYSDYIIERPDYSVHEFKYPYSFKELQKNCIVHSAGLIKRKYLEMVRMKNGEYYDRKLHGPLSKGFFGCTEDYDLWIRLSQICIMVHVPEDLCIVNEHGSNQSLRMTPEIFNQNMRLIIEKAN
jgi:glycosyltransferase involved in cell wall biosynthesis